MNTQIVLPAKEVAGEERLSNKADFKEAVHNWANTLSVKPIQIRVQQMKKKWASCSSRGTLTFSDGLLVQNRSFQEYVIVHELLHLRVPNHGKLFRSLMSLYLPGWEHSSGAELGLPHCRGFSKMDEVAGQVRHEGDGKGNSIS